jgi:hypothetical protein
LKRVLVTRANGALAEAVLPEVDNLIIRRYLGLNYG